MELLKANKSLDGKSSAPYLCTVNKSTHHPMKNFATMTNSTAMTNTTVMKNNRTMSPEEAYKIYGTRNAHNISLYERINLVKELENGMDDKDSGRFYENIVAIGCHALTGGESDTKTGSPYYEYESQKTTNHYYFEVTVEGNICKVVQKAEGYKYWFLDGVYVFIKLGGKVYEMGGRAWGGYDRWVQYNERLADEQIADIMSEFDGDVRSLPQVYGPGAKRLRGTGRFTISLLDAA